MTDQSNAMTAVSLNDGETAVDIPLSPVTNVELPVTNVEPDTSTNTNTSDEDIDSLLQELHTTPSSEATAIENLRRSTNELTSTIGAVTKNIDSKFKVSSNAQHIDAKLGVSSTVSRTSETVVSLWDKIQSNSTTQSIRNSVTETVSKGTRAVGESVEMSGLGGVLNKEKERIKELDSKHGASASGMNFMASGMNFLSKSVKELTKVGSDNDEEEQDYDHLLSTSANESDLKIGDDQVKGDEKMP